MDALTTAAFESRASEAEARLAVLEARLLSGASGGKGGDTEELGALRDELAKAQEDAQKLLKERDAAVAENSKLKYQILHLKRAVVEADQKAVQAA